MTVVSGGMHVFAEVSWGGDIKQQWGSQERQFSVFSETLKMTPALLYNDMQSVISFSVIPKCMTLNGYFALNSVFAPVWLAPTVQLLKNNCAASNKDNTYC